MNDKLKIVGAKVKFSIVKKETGKVTNIRLSGNGLVDFLKDVVKK